VLESLTNPGFPGPGQINSGRVVRIDPSGVKTVIATGLNAPGGMTFGPDGALYVSNFSFGAPLGAGQVVRIEISSKGKKQILSEVTSQPAPQNNTEPATTRQSSVFFGQLIQQSGQESETADSDVTVQQVAANKLSEDSELSSVSVTITEARAVLTGTVSSTAAKAKAEKLIRAVRGIKSVDNKIDVSAP